MAILTLTSGLLLLLMVYHGLAGQAPLVIAHTGSSGRMPDQALETLERAVKDGADVLEFDLFVTKDNKLVVIHDLDLNKTTDVANRTEFSSRQQKMSLTTTAKSLGCEKKEVNGFLVVNFTLSEVKELKKIQGKPFRSKEFNGNYTVPSFDDVLKRFVNTSVSLLVDLKFPSFLNQFLKAADETMEELVLKALKKYKLHKPKNITSSSGKPMPKIYLQSFEEDSIEKLLKMTKLPCILAQMYSKPSSSNIRKWQEKKLYGFSLWKLPSSESVGTVYNKTIKKFEKADMILKQWPSLVNEIHCKNMKVFVYVFAEVFFVPKSLENRTNEIIHFRNLSVDGMLTDFPDFMVKVLKEESLSGESPPRKCHSTSASPMYSLILILRILGYLMSYLVR